VRYDKEKVRKGEEIKKRMFTQVAVGFCLRTILTSRGWSANSIHKNLHIKHQTSTRYLSTLRDWDFPANRPTGANADAEARRDATSTFANMAFY